MGDMYVGQSSVIKYRIVQHVRRTKKLSFDEVQNLRSEFVPGRKVKRELREQVRIVELGGKDVLENKVNPIGPLRPEAVLAQLPDSVRTFLGY